MIDPGWQTYWRYPGDTGVPPTLIFPVPECEIGDGPVAGAGAILRRCRWPFDRLCRQSFCRSRSPTDATHPSSLHLKFGYAVCRTFCVPARPTSTRAYADGAYDAAIEKAEIRRAAARSARVQIPDQVRSRHSLGASRIGRRHDRVVVDVAAPPGAPVSLFVEGPTPDWSLPQPESTGGNGATRQFTFDRWVAARRKGQGRDFDVDRRFQRMTRSRFRPISTNSRGTLVYGTVAAATYRCGPVFIVNARGKRSWRLRLATAHQAAPSW